MSELNGHTPPAKAVGDKTVGDKTVGDKTVDNKAVDNKAATEAELSLKDRLNAETGKLAWSELAPHFARGMVLRVSGSLDLIDVAEKIILDDKVCVERWMTSGDLRRATDDDARDWVKREPEFWCVVSAPWVLAQERSS